MRPEAGTGSSRSGKPSRSTPSCFTSSRAPSSSRGESGSLRNLIEASSDELRLDRMPKILQDVHRVIRDGDVDSVAVLNQAQVEDEKLKAAFLAAHVRT